MKVFGINIMFRYILFTAPGPVDHPTSSLPRVIGTMAFVGVWLVVLIVVAIVAVVFVVRKSKHARTPVAASALQISALPQAFYNPNVTHQSTPFTANAAATPGQSTVAHPPPSHSAQQVPVYILPTQPTGEGQLAAGGVTVSTATFGSAPAASSSTGPESSAPPRYSDIEQEEGKDQPQTEA